ncbi:hypothetical protein O181_021610 [Austropuccinia psidii MF-1]|uniref:Uncharacterized protein n=1 Tax=Austropuccinia psidii MF-1 TaxID=1389203 RepID=A0A9Q3CEX6_9BASI|nr:hypothetical protein [Austropuccinia psidii MF-1]
MLIQHPTPARQTRAHVRTQTFLTPTPRAPLDSTPAVPQLRAQLNRGPIWNEKHHPGSKEEGQEVQILSQE